MDFKRKMHVLGCVILFCGVASFELEELINPVLYPLQRLKRDAVGTLDIITNHADPIHADVKSENGQDSDKPCPKAVLPSMIEAGVGFKVAPPQSSSLSTSQIDPLQSRRKLHPFTNTLEIIRTASRLILMLVLLATAFIEFYPIISNMFQMIYNLMYL